MPAFGLAGFPQRPLAEELGAHHYVDSVAGDPAAALQALGGAAVIALALFCFAVGFALFAREKSGALDYVTLMLPSMIAIGLGWGFGFPALNVRATAAVPDKDQGLAAGLFNTGLQIGGAIGVAIAGAILAGHTAAAAPPATRPPSWTAPPEEADPPSAEHFWFPWDQNASAVPGAGPIWREIRHPDHHPPDQFLLRAIGHLRRRPPHPDLLSEVDPLPPSRPPSLRKLRHPDDPPDPHINPLKLLPAEVLQLAPLQ